MSTDGEIHEHYARGEERDRLLTPFGQVELARTCEIVFPGSFSGFCHRPDDLRDEVLAAGLECVDLVGVEGIAFALADLEERLASPEARAVVLDAARALERVPELLGLSPHLLATARRHPRFVLG